MPHTQREQGGKVCPIENVPEGAKTIINMFKELKKNIQRIKANYNNSMSPNREYQ